MLVVWNYNELTEIRIRTIRFSRKKNKMSDINEDIAIAVSLWNARRQKKKKMLAIILAMVIKRKKIELAHTEFWGGSVVGRVKAYKRWAKRRLKSDQRWRPSSKLLTTTTWCQLGNDRILVFVVQKRCVLFKPDWWFFVGTLI